MDWTALTVAGLAFLVILILSGVIARRQMRSYGKHVDRVTSINDEIRELNLKNHDIALRQLDAINEIKSLLESRKS
jgi:hypothetical protein